MTLRTLVIAPITALTIAGLAGTALAGTDSDDENAGPVATPAPVPFVQAPAPPAVDTPVPAATPEQVPVQTLVGRERVRRPASPTRTRRTRHTRRTSARVRLVNVTHARKGARRAVVPRGGVQAGFGGAA